MPKKYKLDFESDSNGCFLVTSHVLNKHGYAHFRFKKKDVRAHRLVYEECFGPIADGLVVRHKCDVPNCVNPEHLELGTPADNVRDKVDRGRMILSSGEKNGRAILSENIVREVRRMVSAGMTTKDISAELGIKFYTVKKIRERKTWKHVV